MIFPEYSTDMRYYSVNVSFASQFLNVLVLLKSSRPILFFYFLLDSLSFMSQFS